MTVHQALARVAPPEGKPKVRRVNVRLSGRTVEQAGSQSRHAGLSMTEYVVGLIEADWRRSHPRPIPPPPPVAPAGRRDAGLAGEVTCAEGSTPDTMICMDATKTPKLKDLNIDGTQEACYVLEDLIAAWQELNPGDNLDAATEWAESVITKVLV